MCQVEPHCKPANEHCIVRQSLFEPMNNHDKGDCDAAQGIKVFETGCASVECVVCLNVCLESELRPQHAVICGLLYSTLTYGDKGFQHSSRSATKKPHLLLAPSQAE